MKRVIVVGSAGQDGRMLCEKLREAGDAVLGIARGAVEATEPFGADAVEITNAEEVARTVRGWQPDEIYFLAAFHHSSQDREVLDTAELLRRSHEIHVAALVH